MNLNDLGVVEQSDGPPGLEGLGPLRADAGGYATSRGLERVEDSRDAVVEVG